VLLRRFSLCRFVGACPILRLLIEQVMSVEQVEDVERIANDFGVRP
jgi:hypothetical protein